MSDEKKARTSKSRKYRSAKRAEQAAATRKAITVAAATLFAQKGYAGTTVADIAAEAGVATQTVYASVGNKTAVLAAVVGSLAEIVGLPELIADIMAADSPSEAVRGGIRVSGRVAERGKEVIRAIQSAASFDPEAAKMLNEGKRASRKGARQTLLRIVDMGGLRPELSLEQAVAAFATLTRWEVWHMLADEHGWTHEQISEWLFDVTTRSLLCP